ncbi:sterol desaturase family protein [Leeia sp. TBRC 13508]|uniref:Sterol desaturase family protein n=1 Tax=Leeia speluncae TaxID=2884804 RepID=A0ABS8D9T2_9NEIS|nr:sterol desaturase family protein [Leeia speluncae]MCB6184960.1 sterol desaturase family protein [Leeia speluncae]
MIAPASKNYCDRRWLIISSGLGVFTVLTTLGIGYLFEGQIKEHALVTAAKQWPDAIVGLASFTLTSFIFYWWHRATHRFDFLWRVFHQLHHSAKRVEALTAFFAHPLDSAAAILISSFSSYMVLGASPFAAAIALVLTGVFDLFLHSDQKTPTWIGYFIQRPEMHTVHHAYGHHAQNYGLPILDLLFGTWVNPEEREQTLGFDDANSNRITDMLMFTDVHKKRAKEK